MSNFSRIQKSSPPKAWGDERLGANASLESLPVSLNSKDAIPGQFDDVVEDPEPISEEASKSTSVNDGTRTSSRAKRPSSAPEHKISIQISKKHKYSTPSSVEVIDLTSDTDSEHDHHQTNVEGSADTAVPDNKTTKETLPMNDTSKFITSYVIRRAEYLEHMHKMIVMRNSGNPSQVQKALNILKLSFSIPQMIEPVAKESFVPLGPGKVLQSRFEGVSWAGKDGWKASVSFEGVTYRLGTFRVETEAARMHAWTIQFLEGEWSPPIPLQLALLPTTVKTRASRLSPLLPRPPVVPLPKASQNLASAQRSSSASPSRTEALQDLTKLPSASAQGQKLGPLKLKLKRLPTSTRGSEASSNTQCSIKTASKSTKPPPSPNIKSDTALLATTEYLDVANSKAWQDIQHPSPLLDPTRPGNSTGKNWILLLRKALMKVKKPITKVSVVTRLDVVIARGRPIQNVRFENLISKYRDQYQALPVGFRRKLAVNLSTYIQLCGGRFILESHKGTPNFPAEYVEADEVAAVDKIMRVLREKPRQVSRLPAPQQENSFRREEPGTDIPSETISIETALGFLPSKSVDKHPMAPKKVNLETLVHTSTYKQQLDLMTVNPPKVLVAARSEYPVKNNHSIRQIRLDDPDHVSTLNIKKKQEGSGFSCSKEELPNRPAKDMRHSTLDSEPANSSEVPFAFANNDLQETSRNKRKEKRLPHYLLF